LISQQRTTSSKTGLVQAITFTFKLEIFPSPNPWCGVVELKNHTIALVVIHPGKRKTTWPVGAIFAFRVGYPITCDAIGIIGLGGRPYARPESQMAARKALSASHAERFAKI
jgi:hypothetical protein